MNQVSKNKNIFYFFALFISLLISCKREPADIYFVKLEKPGDPPALDFGFKIKSDTIAYYENTFLALNINQGKYKITSAICYIDSQERNFSNSNDMLTIELYNLANGPHKFQLKIITSSGTNSIADKIKAEGYQYTTPELILVKKDLWTPNKGQSVVLNNGVSLTWKEYDGLNIKKYLVKKISTGESFETTNTSFFDSSYSGENGNYDIYVIDNSDEKLRWAICSISGNLPVLKIGSVQNKVALTWNPSIFINNIKEYQVLQSVNTGPWQYLSTVNVQDTFFILNYNEFGGSADYALYSVPKNSPDDNYKYLFYSRYSGVIAIPGPYFSSNYRPTCSGFYYDSGEPLYWYSMPTNSSVYIAKDFWGLDISPNSKYLILPANNTSIKLYDQNGTNLIKTVDLSSIIKYFQNARISDNSYCVFRSSDTLFYYDMLNENLVVKYKMNNPYDLSISSNGKYIILSISDSLIICTLNGNSINILSKNKLSTYSPLYDFCPNDPEKLYVYESPYIRLKSCSDFSTINTINVGDGFKNIDFCSNKILSSSQNYFKIYDLNTGILLESISSEFWGGARNYTLLCNNIIFRAHYKYYLK